IGPQPIGAPRRVDVYPSAPRAGRRKFSSVDLSVRLDLVTRERLPLLCCLVAFILTFFVTRTIVRYIRAHAGSDAPRKWWQPRNIRHGSPHNPQLLIRGRLVQGL